MIKFFIPLCTGTLFLLLITYNPVVIATSSDDMDVDSDHSYREEEFKDLYALIEEAAEKQELINGILTLDFPKEIGKLGEGFHAIVWKGTLHKKTLYEKRVAVKFLIDTKLAKLEIDFFHKLNAFQNEAAEEIGITVLYHEGVFRENYHIMAITLCDESLKDRIKKNSYFLPENVLRMSYQLIRGLQYMHLKNVAHCDLNMENVMFRRDQIFIIDFNGAEITYEKDKLRICSDDLYYVYSMMQTSIGKSTYNPLEVNNQIRNEVAKEMFIYFNNLVIHHYPLNRESIDKEIKHQNYRKLLEKSLDGIQRLTGTKDISIDWNMEKAMRNPAPLVGGLSTMKFALNKLIKQNYGNEPFSEFERKIKVNHGGVLEAKQHGKLWSDQFGIYWKGLLKSANASQKIDVTIKFGPNKMWIDRLYRMHRLMGAVNNDAVVKNGIPNVCYFTQNAIVFTFFHQRIMDKIAKEGGKISSVNLLRILYQGIYSLKDIHGKGVLHQNLQLDSLVIYGSRLLLIGFEYAEVNRIRYSNNFGGNELFGSISFSLGILRSYIDDIKSLFYIILHIAGIDLPWRNSTIPVMIARHKNSHENILYLIHSKIENRHVQEVLKQFYVKVFLPFKIAANFQVTDYDSRVPPYVELGNLVLEGMKNITGTRADPLFDWPSDLPKIQMQSINSVIGPANKEEDILYLGDNEEY